MENQSNINSDSTSKVSSESNKMNNLPQESHVLNGINETNEYSNNKKRKNYMNAEESNKKSIENDLDFHKRRNEKLLDDMSDIKTKIDRFKLLLTVLSKKQEKE